MKRPSTIAGAAGDRPECGRLFESAPLTIEYLTNAVWEDGEERQLSTITIFRQDGAWKVWLNDRACERFVCLTGTTVEQAIASLEKQLREDTVAWRVSKDTRGGRRK
jgi:hypothetical protein